jgi:hypothetical protein
MEKQMLPSLSELQFVLRVSFPVLTCCTLVALLPSTASLRVGWTHGQTPRQAYFGSETSSLPSDTTFEFFSTTTMPKPFRLLVRGLRIEYCRSRVVSWPSFAQIASSQMHSSGLLFSFVMASGAYSSNEHSHSPPRDVHMQWNTFARFSCRRTQSYFWELHTMAL